MSLSREPTPACTKASPDELGSMRRTGSVIFRNSSNGAGIVLPVLNQLGADPAFNIFELPHVALQAVFVLLALGFRRVLVAAWYYLPHSAS